MIFIYDLITQVIEMWQTLITFCWNKLLSSACFSEFFALIKAKEISFHLLAIQILIKLLIFLHWILIFLSIVMSIGRKKPKQTSLPKPINPATKLSLLNHSKTDLSVLWHTEKCNFVVDYNELVST